MFHKKLVALGAMLTAAALAAACGSSASTSSAADSNTSATASGSASTGSSPSSSGSSSAAASPSGAESAASPSGKLSVALMVPGLLGDLGFFDSAESGIKDAEKTLGATTKTVEGGANQTQAWTTDLQGLSQSGDYNVIVTGSSNVVDQLKAVAKQYPNQKYIQFDTPVDGPNIASTTYQMDQAAFLAGVLAAVVSEDSSDYPLSKGNKNVGLVGGQDIPVIQDFVVGFKAGVKAVDPAIKVQISYIGSFNDPNTGFSQAASMYSAGADVVFAAAGQSGLGVLKAAESNHRYAIGVDSDQNGLYPDVILASAVKAVGPSIVDLLKEAQAGTLKYGKTYVYGIANDGVQLILNDKLIKDSTKPELEKYTDMVKAGTVTVPCVDPYCVKTGS